MPSKKDRIFIVFHSPHLPITKTSVAQEHAGRTHNGEESEDRQGRGRQAGCQNWIGYQFEPANWNTIPYGDEIDQKQRSKCAQDFGSMSYPGALRR